MQVFHGLYLISFDCFIEQKQIKCLKTNNCLSRRPTTRLELKFCCTTGICKKARKPLKTALYSIAVFWPFYIAVVLRGFLAFLYIAVYKGFLAFLLLSSLRMSTACGCTDLFINEQRHEKTCFRDFRQHRMSSGLKFRK